MAEVLAEQVVREEQDRHFVRRQTIRRQLLVAHVAPAPGLPPEASAVPPMPDALLPPTEAATLEFLALPQAEVTASKPTRAARTHARFHPLLMHVPLIAP